MPSAQPISLTDVCRIRLLPQDETQAASRGTKTISSSPLLREAAPGRVRLAATMLYRGNDRARLARAPSSRARPACR